MVRSTANPAREPLAARAILGTQFAPAGAQDLHLRFLLTIRQPAIIGRPSSFFAAVSAHAKLLANGDHHSRDSTHPIRRELASTHQKGINIK